MADTLSAALSQPTPRRHIVLDGAYLEGVTPDGPAVVGELSVVVDEDGITVFGPTPDARRALDWERVSPVTLGAPGTLPDGTVATTLEFSLEGRQLRLLVATALVPQTGNLVEDIDSYRSPRNGGISEGKGNGASTPVPEVSEDALIAHVDVEGGSPLTVEPVTAAGALEVELAPPAEFLTEVEDGGQSGDISTAVEDAVGDAVEDAVEDDVEVTEPAGAMLTESHDERAPEGVEEVEAVTEARQDAEARHVAGVAPAAEPGAQVPDVVSVADVAPVAYATQAAKTPEAGQDAPEAGEVPPPDSASGYNLVDVVPADEPGRQQQVADALLVSFDKRFEYGTGYGTGYGTEYGIEYGAEYGTDAGVGEDDLPEDPMFETEDRLWRAPRLVSRMSLEQRRDRWRWIVIGAGIVVMSGVAVGVWVTRGGTPAHPVHALAARDTEVARNVGIRAGDLAGWPSHGNPPGNPFAAGASQSAAAMNAAQQATADLARCLHVPQTAVDGAFGLGGAVTPSGHADSPMYAEPSGNGDSVSSSVDVMRSVKDEQSDFRVFENASLFATCYQPYAQAMLPYSTSPGSGPSGLSLATVEPVDVPPPPDGSAAQVVAFQIARIGTQMGQTVTSITTAVAIFGGRVQATVGTVSDFVFPLDTQNTLVHSLEARVIGANLL